MFLFIVYFFAWLLLRSCVRYLFASRCSNRCFVRVFPEESHALSTFITFLLESCFDIGLSSAVTIKFMSNERFSTAAETMSSVLAYWFAFALLVAPSYLIITGCRLYGAVLDEDKAGIARYSELFENKRMRSIYAILHSTVFFSRRYIIIFLIFFAPNRIFTQLWVTTHTAIYVTGYTLLARPFVEPIMNKQEVFNEICVLIYSYSLFVYTDIIIENETLRVFGWVSVGIIAGTILINLLFMCFISCLQLILKARIWKAKRIAKKL
mmetsp:Transcript_18451/g.24776  ORF Transcript_18451/g.24776 Transcript_18451/m.24776 type:complete len:266 (+) Transcript_18451:577-1374(+)